MIAFQLKNVKNVGIFIVLIGIDSLKSDLIFLRNSVRIIEVACENAARNKKMNRPLLSNETNYVIDSIQLATEEKIRQKNQFEFEMQ